jgi:hypothetical protein
MSMCSVDEVRDVVSPRSLTDEDILNIITRVTKSVDAQTGCGTGSTDTLANLACIELSAAAVLRKMRVNGELPARVKIGNSEQQNTIDQDIDYHEAEAAKYINEYKRIAKKTEYKSYCIPYGRVGVGTVNNGD